MLIVVGGCIFDWLWLPPEFKVYEYTISSSINIVVRYKLYGLHTLITGNIVVCCTLSVTSVLAKPSRRVKHGINGLSPGPPLPKTNARVVGAAIFTIRSSS